MFQSPDYERTLSMKLSEVMEDISVNEEMVWKRRRVFQLMEGIRTVTYRSAGENKTIYYLGSQSEVTTTLGLDSDLDILCVNHDFNVMHDWSEWKQNKKNYIMVHGENVTPGYCFLQLVRKARPFPATCVPDDYHIRDGSGRILLKNTNFYAHYEDAKRQGPSNAVKREKIFSGLDFVHGLTCNSWPKSVSNLIKRLGMVRCPSFATSKGCLLVGFHSKISTFPEIEWRISTSLAERCLMFNLNITQIQCYVLMKIVLKSFLNHRKINGMSSFMCKTVLLHCIENTEQSMWMKNKLLTCLKYCLIELRRCVQNEHCSHFMIPENNLMAGQFTVEVKHKILETLSDIIQSDGRYLLRINIDDIGPRLKVKLNTSKFTPHKFSTPNRIEEICLSNIYIKLAQCIIQCLWDHLNIFRYANIRDLMQFNFNLTNFSVSGSKYERLTSRYVKPLFCSTLGSTLAARCIKRNETVSTQALTWLYLGLDPDVTSGRLKLASVLYCTGDMYRAELVLRQIEMEYDTDTIVPICSCSRNNVPLLPAEFKRKCRRQAEYYVIRHMTSFCVIFLQIELNCVPRELRYEMTRSTKDDLPYRSKDERPWMDYAVIDSLPLLYFIQYKTYDRLQKYQDKQHALNNLLKTIVTSHGFGHRETALNLLGQCMEQENRPREALHYYMLSLRQRARNNAAKIHICCLIAEYVRNGLGPNCSILLYVRDKTKLQ